MGEARNRARRIAELARDVDRICDGDRLFFERHPGRSTRFRIAGEAEVETLRLVHGDAEVRLPPGERYYVFVRNVGGNRIRIFRQNVDGVDCDVPEEYAAAAFDHIAPPGSQGAWIEAALAKLGAP